MPYKEGDKWRGQIRIGEHRFRKLFASKREARAWEVAEKKRLLASRTHSISLVEAGTKYLTYCQARFTRTTFDDKRRVLRDLGAVIGNHSIDQIRSEQILEILLKKPTRNNYNRTRKDLHAFFEYCKRFHGLAKNPVADIDKLPVERGPQPVPTEEEFIRLLLAADRHDRNLLVALVTTGGRRSEIFRWTWAEDVNFERRLVRLGSRKSRSGEMRYRWVRMNDMLYEALQDQWQSRLPQSDYVFQNRDPRHPRYGDRYTARRKLMRGLCQRAGIRPFGFHAVRRFFASILADKHKESIPTIQKLLGHASPNTTERYIYNITQDAKAVVDKISFDIHGIEKGGNPTTQLLPACEVFSSGAIDTPGDF